MNEVPLPFVCAENPEVLRNDNAFGIMPMLSDEVNSGITFSHQIANLGFANTENFSICRDDTGGKFLVGTEIFSNDYEGRILFSGSYLVQEQLVTLGESQFLVNSETVDVEFLLRIDFKNPDIYLPSDLYEMLILEMERSCEGYTCPLSETTKSMKCFDHNPATDKLDWLNYFPLISFKLYGKKLILSPKQYTFYKDNQMCVRVLHHESNDEIRIGWVALYDRTISFDVSKKELFIHGVSCNQLRLMFIMSQHIKEEDVDHIILIVVIMASVLAFLVIIGLIWSCWVYIKGLRADLKKLKEDPDNPVINKKRKTIKKKQKKPELDDDFEINEENFEEVFEQFNEKYNQKKGKKGNLSKYDEDAYMPRQLPDNNGEFEEDYDDEHRKSRAFPESDPQIIPRKPTEPRVVVSKNLSEQGKKLKERSKKLKQKKARAIVPAIDTEKAYTLDLSSDKSGTTKSEKLTKEGKINVGLFQAKNKVHPDKNKITEKLDNNRRSSSQNMNNSNYPDIEEYSPNKNDRSFDLNTSSAGL